MAILVIAVSVSLLFAFLATQNTFPVTLQAGGYFLRGIPLYIVVLGSLLFGIALSWFLSMFGWIGSAMTISQKERVIKDKNKNVERLEARIQDLEVENAKLKENKRHEEIERPGTPLIRKFRNIGSVS